MKKINKSNAVLNHLKKYGSITSWKAITEYRATRLSAIIYNLRKKGYDIESVYVTSHLWKAPYVEYHYYEGNTNE